MSPEMKKRVEETTLSDRIFLMIKGNISDNHTKDCIAKINSLSLVLTSFNVNPNQLKSKQNLLF